MKTILCTVITIFSCCFHSYSQQWSCSTISPDLDLLTDVLGITSYNSLSRSSANNTSKSIAVYVHIVRTSTGGGGLSTTLINNAINILKADYQNCNIGIEEIGRDFIDDNGFYYNFSDYSYNALISTKNQSNAINIYFLAPGIDYGRASNIPGLALVLGGNYAGTSVLSHEMGHCLGLYHTHSGSGCGDNANCQENINGDNCSTCGDLVCDTPADPCLTGKVNNNCQYTGGFGYNPDTRNIMSYAPPTCLSRLSSGQIARLHTMIENSSILQKVLRLQISGNSNPYSLQQVNYTIGIGAGSSVNWSGSSNVQFIGGQAGPSVTVSFCGGNSATLTATVSGTVNQTFTKTVQINNGELHVYPGIGFMETHLEHPYAQCYDWRIGTNFTSYIGNGLITCSDQSSTSISRQQYGYDETIEVRAQANGCYTPWQRTSFQAWGPQIDEGASYLNPMSREPFYACLVEPYPGYAEYYWYIGGMLIDVTSEPSIHSYYWPCGEYNLTVEVGGTSASASFWGMCTGWRYYSYPNPANDHLTVEVKEETPNTLQSKAAGSTTLSAQQTKTPKGEVILRLYDGRQQLVRNQTIGSDLKQVNINTAGLVNGTYFLNIIKDNKVIDRQTIIIKH